MTPEDTVRELNDLLQICRDGEEGYRNAAENVRNSELDSVFSGYAKQRAKFAQELREEIERLGSRAEDSGTLGGALHRGWMDLKSAFTGGDAGAILAACQSGEESADAAYDRLANTDISGKTRTLIEHQWQQIKEAHTRMRRLKRETEGGAEFQTNET